MVTKFKHMAAATALALTPVVGSAASIHLVEGGTANEFTVGDELLYAQTGLGPAAGSLTFSLDAIPPTEAELSAQLNTLEFTGTFNNLVITLDGEAATLVGTFTNTTLYEVDSIFNSTNGFTQELVISWDSVSPAEGISAGINIQGVVAAVPVPAGGLLLISALGGIMVLRRRKAAA